MRPYIKMASRAAWHPLAKPPRPISRTLPPIATTRAATAHRAPFPLTTHVGSARADARRDALRHFTRGHSAFRPRPVRRVPRLFYPRAAYRPTTDENPGSHSTFLLSKWMGAPTVPLPPSARFELTPVPDAGCATCLAGALPPSVGARSRQRGPRHSCRPGGAKTARIRTSRRASRRPIRRAVPRLALSRRRRCSLLPPPPFLSPLGLSPRRHFVDISLKKRVAQTSLPPTRNDHGRRSHSAIFTNFSRGRRRRVRPLDPVDLTMTYKRKKYHRGDTHLKKGWRTKRRTRDLDEVSRANFVRP